MCVRESNPPQRKKPATVRSRSRCRSGGGEQLSAGLEGKGSLVKQLCTPVSLPTSHFLPSLCRHLPFFTFVYFLPLLPLPKVSLYTSPSRLQPLWVPPPGLSFRGPAAAMALRASVAGKSGAGGEAHPAPEQGAGFEDRARVRNATVVQRAVEQCGTVLRGVG